MGARKLFRRIRLFLIFGIIVMWIFGSEFVKIVELLVCNRLMKEILIIAICFYTTGATSVTWTTYPFGAHSWVYPRFLVGFVLRSSVLCVCFVDRWLPFVPCLAIVLSVLLRSVLFCSSIVINTVIVFRNLWVVMKAGGLAL